MNILLVTKGSLMGGVERHILSLMQGFSGYTDHNFYLAVFSDSFLSLQARHLGKEVFVISKRFRGDILPIFHLFHLIKEKKIDIIHTHLISGNFYGGIAGKFGKIKIVSTLHHSHQEALGHFVFPFMQGLFFKLDIKMAAISDCIITPSENLRFKLAQYGVPKNKIVKIANGISLDHLDILNTDIAERRKRLGFGEHEKLVGMVGRMVTVKNFQLLLKAAKRYLSSGKKATFVLIGDGPLREELQKIADNLNISQHIVFTGFRDDRLDLISILDLFVLCSNSETFPLALIEAMSLAKPVIASNVDGIPEIIDDRKTGFLCKPNDDITLTKLIENLLDHEHQALAVGKKAQQKVVEQFSMQIMTKNTIQIYEKLYHTNTVKF